MNIRLLDGIAAAVAAFYLICWTVRSGAIDPILHPEVIPAFATCIAVIGLMSSAMGARDTDRNKGALIPDDVR